MTLFDELGGREVLESIVRSFVDRVARDPMIGFMFRNTDLEHLREKEFEHAARLLGANVEYTGRPLGQAHRVHRINTGQFNRRTKILSDLWHAHGVPEHIQDAWRAHIESLRPQILGR